MGCVKVNNKILAGPENIRDSYNRMRMRRKAREAANVLPDFPCANCGRKNWQTGIDGEWLCFNCGNRGYWNMGIFVQGGKHCD